MKLRISRTAARSAAIAAVAARIFYALAVETPIHNGVWLSALLGALPVLPLLLMLDALCRRGGPRSLFRVLMRLLMLVALLADCGLMLSVITRSSGFLAQNHTRPLYLALPVMLATLWCVCRNGDAIGYGAVLWMRIFPCLLGVVLLLQLRHYRPQWLLPLLGNGWQSILAGSLRASYCYAPIFALWLVCEDDSGRGERQASAIIPMVFPAVAAALLLALRLMMAPTMIWGDSWLNRLDILLTNGRAPLYLQLPMMILWFAGLLHLLACECFAASALLQWLLPRLDGRICATLVTLVAAIVSFSALNVILSDSNALLWLFAAIFVLAALSAIGVSRSKGGAKQCA